MVGYPPEFAHRYRSEGYWTGQTHTDLLEGAASLFGDRTAVLDARRSLTYRELLTGSRRLANGLSSELGLEPGDRVVVQMPNVSEYLEVIFALFDAGVLPVFALASHRISEIDQLVTDTDAAAYITVGTSVPTQGGTDFGELARTIAATHPAVRTVVADLAAADSLADYRSTTVDSTGRSGTPDAVAFLQLSGGTTGRPKLIERTHDDYLYSVRESARICGLSAASNFGVVLPVSHNFTMSSPGVLGAIHAGARIVMVADTDAETVFDTVQTHRITHLSVVPPLLAAWLDSPARSRYDLSSLEVIGVGGAKLSQALARRVPETFGATLQQVFGMAEGLVNYTRLDDPAEVIESTQGRPISPADELRVVDAQGNPVPVGEQGSLQTRGPYTIRGYRGGIAADSFTDDGFYRTGDIVVLDDAGYLTVVGRDKDQINRAGEKIAPEEVENMLLTHRGVRDASVVGVADERLGERVCAYVIASETSSTPPTDFELRAFLRTSGLAQFKIPDDIFIVAEFPTTAVGKVSKNSQSSLASSARGSEGADLPLFPPAEPLDAASIVADLADKLGIDAGRLDDPSLHLLDTGIDSLALMALLEKWRAAGAYGLELEVLATAESIADLVARVRAAAGLGGTRV